MVKKGALHSQVNAVSMAQPSDNGKVVLSLSSGATSQLLDDQRLDEVDEALKRVSNPLRLALSTVLAADH